VDLRAAMGVLGEALRNRMFLGYVMMFGFIGAAQMAFGVVAPFLYEVKLGFSPAAYGLVALFVGLANLTGELACGGLAQRTTTARLASRALAVFFLGALILLVSAALGGLNAWMITLGAAVALLGCGVLDPQSKGLAMGVFTRNIGLVAGLVNTCCYLVVSMAIGLMSYVPEESQAPLGWLYAGVAVVFAALLFATVSPWRRRSASASNEAAPMQAQSDPQLVRRLSQRNSAALAVSRARGRGRNHHPAASRPPAPEHHEQACRCLRRPRGTWARRRSSSGCLAPHHAHPPG
jgi:MFS transporter, DHA1 family, multidrug resistance protein